VELFRDFGKKTGKNLNNDKKTSLDCGADPHLNGYDKCKLGDDCLGDYRQAIHGRSGPWENP
jgi:hypothetical protein